MSHSHRRSRFGIPGISPRLTPDELRAVGRKLAAKTKREQRAARNRQRQTTRRKKAA